MSTNKGHLVVTSVSMSFNHFTPYSISALKGISLEVMPGDFCVLAGPNGSGKSTLIKLISGRIPIPDSGDITLDGNQIVSVPEHKRAKWISYVAQHPVDGTAPSLTVAENLKLAEMREGGTFSFSLGLNRKKKESYRQLLSSIGLDNRLDQPVSTLSGGERQMLTILMSSFGPPSLILLDEPVSALDPSHSEMCLNLISSLNKERSITILMVTHNVSQILTLGSKLLIVKEGKAIDIYQGNNRATLTPDTVRSLIYD